ncbi:hypothetical protein [Flavobacterium daejeonense]|uniref:hypothetical protein n=1 Tax=Flavobacterium daejeonense TaxID=350893 RepID=UPI0012DFBFCA|nr:hypothetical protein [Flavobacterium daejeonense]
MNRFFLVAIFIISGYTMNAQDGYKHFFFKGGAVISNGINVGLGFDFAGQYYNSVEISANYFKRNDLIDYENYLFGVNYKPLLFRERNTLGKLRVGVYAGSGTENFAIAPNIGFEFIQSLSNNVDLFLSNDNGYYFETSQKWVTTANIGLRIAL